MAKITKTWKLGEWAIGGIITVEITGKVITIISKEWDNSIGTKKSSNQSKAKELQRGTIEATDSKAEQKIEMFLNDLTTSYYSSEILKWIGTKVAIEKNLFW